MKFGEHYHKLIFGITHNLGNISPSSQLSKLVCFMWSGGAQRALTHKFPMKLSHKLYLAWFLGEKATIFFYKMDSYVYTLVLGG